MPRVLQRTAATAAAVALVATLSGCASSDSGFSAAADHMTTVAGRTAPIVAWYRETGPKIATVEQSITYAQWMVRRPTHRGLHDACRQIHTDVSAARAAPGPPDARARAALTAELRAFDGAATHCLAGDLRAAGTSVDTGHRYAEISGKRIVALLHAAS